jgi:maltose alpha-D-glucosyltransferase/alpha-amylase
VDAPEGATVVDAGFLARVRTLAQCTAALHAALAQPTGDAAFDPEPLLAQDLHRWAAQARQRATTTLTLLRQNVAHWPEALQLPAQRVLHAASALDQRLAGGEALHPGGIKTRVHGSYRLEEVLVVHDDFVIIDFEGDPARPVEERRAKQPALRDVASMMCSFELARQAALQLGAHADTEASRREQAARAWCDAAREHFLQAYTQAVAAGGLQAEVDDLSAQTALLELFELDCAVHELHDALQRRPEAIAAALAVLAARCGP